MTRRVERSDSLITDGAGPSSLSRDPPSHGASIRPSDGNSTKSGDCVVAVVVDPATVDDNVKAAAAAVGTAESTELEATTTSVRLTGGVATVADVVDVDVET